MMIKNSIHGTPSSTELRCIEGTGLHHDISHLTSAQPGDARIYIYIRNIRYNNINILHTPPTSILTLKPIELEPMEPEGTDNQSSDTTQGECLI